MSKDEFDQLIKDGELAKAGRLFAKEGYENGDFGFTRKQLIEALTERYEQSDKIKKEFYEDINFKRREVSELNERVQKLEKENSQIKEAYQDRCDDLEGLLEHFGTSMEEMIDE